MIICEGSGSQIVVEQRSNFGLNGISLSRVSARIEKQKG